MRRGARRGPTAVEKGKRNKVILLIAAFLIIASAWAYTFWRINQIGAALKEAREKTDNILEAGAETAKEQEREVKEHAVKTRETGRQIHEQVRTDISNLDAVAVADGVRDELRLLLRERRE